MSERVLARIWIGGQLKHGESYKLVMAVREAQVSIGSPGWEHIICWPRSIEGLLEATDEGILHLQDDDAPDGDMPLTQLCRRLGLTYRTWHEATLDGGCRVEVWEPGMEEPIHMHGDPLDPFVHFVESLPVQLVIAHIREGRTDAALALLERACPDIPEVPPLVVVED